MRDIDGLEISPRKAEYLKYILQQNEPVKTKDISTRFDVDPSTITKTMSELVSAGLVEHRPYRSISLTEAGLEHAKFFMRRHRLLGLVLTHFGLSGQEACRAASQFEGFVSKEVIDKICTSLGHPTMGICGRITHDTCCCCPNDEIHEPAIPTHP